MMRYDDTKLRARVRAEAFREAAAICRQRKCVLLAERFDRLAAAASPPDSYPFADITDCVEDDGFLTVHPPVWPGADGGLDG